MTAAVPTAPPGPRLTPAELELWHRLCDISAGMTRGAAIDWLATLAVLLERRGNEAFAALAKVATAAREAKRLCDEQHLTFGRGKQFPGHAHEVNGIWDVSNGPPKGGKPCRECGAWSRLEVVLKEET